MVYNHILLDRKLTKTLKVGFCKGLVAFSLISLLSFSSVVYTLPRSAEAQSTEDFETWTNTQYGIIIQYPANWEVDEEPNVGIVAFGPSSESISVEIFVDNQYPGTTLDEYQETLIKVYKTFLLEDLEVVEIGKTTLSGLPAKSVTFTGKIKQQDVSIDVKMTQVFTIKDDIAYRIQYGSAQSQYPVYLSTATKMIDSFKIDPSIIPQEVSGTYVNEKVGLRINLPGGWSGFETKRLDENTTVVAVAPADGPSKLSMMILILDLSEIGEQIEEAAPGGCQTTSVTYTNLNGMSAIEFVGECDRPESFSKTKVYILTTKEKAIWIMYIAPSRTAYDNNIVDFEASARTSSIKDTVNAFNAIVYNISRTPQEISGKYVNSEAGISIELPGGWRGFESVQDNTTVVTVVPPIDETGASFMTIALHDASSYGEEECKASSIEYAKLNSMSTLQTEAECEIQMMKMKSKGYVFATKDKIVDISYVAPTTQDYNLNLDKFEQAIKTLSIKNTVDVTAYVPLSIDFKSSKKQVTVDDKPYTIEVTSSSNVSNIEFNQEDSQLSFAVQGESGTKGTSFIKVDKVLEGPYIVTADGVSTDFDIIEDSATGQSTIAVSYSHDAHSIVVAGTRVIPEFPFTMVGVIAAIIGLVVMTRIKLYRQLSGHQ